MYTGEWVGWGRGWGGGGGGVGSGWGGGGGKGGLYIMKQFVLLYTSHLLPHHPPGILSRQWG